MVTYILTIGCICVPDTYFPHKLGLIRWIISPDRERSQKERKISSVRRDRQSEGKIDTLSAQNNAASRLRLVSLPTY
jgi:hypothetical protein